MFTKSIIILACIGVAFAAQAIGPLPPKPKELAQKEGCYIEEMKDVVPFGTKVYPEGTCEEISCGEDIITYISCGSVAVLPGQYLTEPDYSKQYPACCPTAELKV